MFKPSRYRVIQWLIDIALLCLGVAIGIAISRLSMAPTFKLLNILGLSFDLLGVLLITLVVALPERPRTFIIEWGGVVSVSLTAFFMVGTLVGVMLGEKFFSGKSHDFPQHLFAVAFFGQLSAYFLEDTVMIPKFRSLQAPDRRLKVMGGYYVLAGLLIQLYAAFYDLWS